MVTKIRRSKEVNKEELFEEAENVYLAGGGGLVSVGGGVVVGGTVVTKEVGGVIDEVTMARVIPLRQ